MKNLSFHIIALILLASCQTSSKKEDTTQIRTSEEQTFPNKIAGSTIYEVNIRQFTPEGTIEAFSDHLPRLKDLGVDVLWLMPIHPISETNRK